MDYKASIIITTKNRKDELAKAIQSCLKLKGDPEIFIFDDGSEDGTFDFVKNTYPQCILHRENNSLGLIDARTKAATLVKGDIIFSIDDDACFSDEDTIINFLPYFNQPKVADVSIPYIDIYQSSKIRQKGIGTIDDLYICPQYKGTAHALRRDIFLKLGGYRKNLVRQEEETDYAIRLYKNDFLIRLGNCKPILHHESPKRNLDIIAFYSARNNIILAWIYSPILFILPYCINLVIELALWGFKRNCLKAIFSGLNNSFFMILRMQLKREPLTNHIFLQYRLLRKYGYKKIEV